VAACSNYTNVDSLEHWEKMSASEKEKRIEQSRQKLNGSGAHYVIDSIVDLPNVVKDINARLSKGEKP